MSEASVNLTGDGLNTFIKGDVWLTPGWVHMNTPGGPSSWPASQVRRIDWADLVQIAADA